MLKLSTNSSQLSLISTCCRQKDIHSTRIGMLLNRHLRTNLNHCVNAYHLPWQQQNVKSLLRATDFSDKQVMNYYVYFEVSRCDNRLIDSKTRNENINIINSIHLLLLYLLLWLYVVEVVWSQRLLTYLSLLAPSANENS